MYMGGGGGSGASISNSCDTQVLVNERVSRFGRSEEINLTRSGEVSNDSGFDISFALDPPARTPESDEGVIS